MSRPSDIDFVDISIAVFDRIDGQMPFDVYIRRASDTFTKLFPRNEDIDRRRVESYRNQKGVAHLFVHKLDFKQYLLYVDKIAADLLADGKLGQPEEVLELVKEMTRL